MAQVLGFNVESFVRGRHARDNAIGGVCKAGEGVSAPAATSPGWKLDFPFALHVPASKSLFANERFLKNTRSRLVGQCRAQGETPA